VGVGCGLAGLVLHCVWLDTLVLDFSQPLVLNFRDLLGLQSL
jgi:hypothetical protein